jgi:beta-galactosidase/beta-glucuronidase
VELLVRRDRNHPSIVIWSLCNEVLCENSAGGKTGDGKVAEGVIHALDPVGTRPVSANNNGMNGAATILDLQA